MIYKKDANFPYPLLTNTSSSYSNANFILDIELEENTQGYRFTIDYDIDSEFITNLLKNEKAHLILVIQSRDNKFYNLEFGEKFKIIPKSRLSLSKRTVVQLLIKSNEEIDFKDNDDLNDFYKEFKNEIVVPKNSILGFSNTVTFEGSSSKPLELFEKSVDPNLKSDLDIELGSETIIIKYKNESLQFIDSPISQTLNNAYVYMGLQKALYRFVMNNGEDGEVDLDEIDVPENSLDLKLYNLMKKKMVTDVNLENIDSVIYLISDKILEKFSSAVRGLYL